VKTGFQFFSNVAIKGMALFLALNLFFAWMKPLPALGRISAYNRLIPGRQRLPYADNPQRAYSLSLFNLEAMFASHEIASGLKPPGEFRVILIGDSATWGFLLEPQQTLSAYINAAGLQMPDGRSVRAYNLGYPVMSVAKDLLVLSSALRYQPDLVVWPITLESLPYDKQLFSPLLQHNPAPVRALIRTYGLSLDPSDPSFVDPGLFERTLVGQRRALADLLRLQAYGLMWAATGIDQDIPQDFTPRQEDLPPDQNFHNLTPPDLHPGDLAFDVLDAGVRMAAPTPILFVNEPVFISQGANSDVRYNFFYPRWAYDDYRAILRDHAIANHWHYRDHWDAIPASQFTNTAIHMDWQGARQFADLLAQAILETVGQP
jgi:hypothetical protein